jgi:DNA gyrase/topoisomerase IV subunit A
MTMQAQQVSTQQLILEIERLRQEVKDLKQDKTDLEILLETTTAHADAIEAQLHQSNQQLQAEIVERQRAQAVLQALASELQSLVTDITRAFWMLTANPTTAIRWRSSYFAREGHRPSHRRNCQRLFNSILQELTRCILATNFLG